MTTPENQEELLRRKADQVRNRLLDVVDELDRRRHELTDHPADLVVSRIPQKVWIGAAVAGALLVVSVTGATIAAVRRKNKRVLYIKRAPPPPSFAGDVVSRAGRALATMLLVQLGKRAFDEVAARTRLTSIRR